MNGLFATITLIGESYSGKSTWIQKIYGESQSFLYKQIYFDKRFRDVKIWDTNGNERFREINKYYMKISDIIIVFIDISNHLNYEDNVEPFINAINESKLSSTNKKHVILLGNKLDKVNSITSSFMKQKANELDLPYFEMSCTQTDMCLSLSDILNKTDYLFDIEMANDSSIDEVIIDDTSERNYSPSKICSIV